MQRLKHFHTTCGLAILFALAAHPALAHHPLGGATPVGIWEGLLSGIGHPIIGFDHLAFVLAAGILAAQASRRAVILYPAIFVSGTCFGTLLHVGGATQGFHFHDVLIAVSVIAAGGVIMMGRGIDRRVAMAGFGVAGIIHGHAYGDAVLGAEATPIIAYIMGFGATQMVLAMAAAMATMLFLRGGQAGRTSAIAPRLMGAVIAGIGLAYCVEIAEAAIFPAI